MSSNVRPSRRCASCFLSLSVAVVVLPVGCGQLADDEGTSRSAATSCWDPGFGTRNCSQSSWWIEFSVKDATTSALSVEIAGNPIRTVALPNRVPLGGGYVKFTGGPDAPVATGTQVRLHAATSGDTKTAQSLWFAYRKIAPALDCNAPDAGAAADSGADATVDSGADATVDSGADATVDSGADATAGADATVDSGADAAVDSGADGGCVASWSPTWQQTGSAGAWWAEFQVFGGGSLARSVAFEVVGGATTPLGNDFGRWTSGLNGVASGTLVVLHATDATGATAQTAPFRYLVDTTPATDACKGTPSALPTCKPLARGMVTITMDDSNESQWTLAAPVLAKYGYKATIHHITDQLANYGLLPMAQSLAAAGHEVASHSKSHPYLTGVTAAQLDDELRLSQQYLLANVGSPVESFASPMGAYDSTVLAAIKKVYKSHRTVNVGLNYMGSSLYELNADGVYNDSTTSSVCASLTETASSRGWRILVFHDFTSAASSGMSLTYPIASFDDVLGCMKATPGLDVVTTREGVAAIACASP